MTKEMGMKCGLLASGEGASASSSSGTLLGFQVQRWPGWAAEDREDGGDPISPRPMSDELNGRNTQKREKDTDNAENETRSRIVFPKIDPLHEVELGYNLLLQRAVWRP